MHAGRGPLSAVVVTLMLFACSGGYHDIDAGAGEDPDAGLPDGGTADYWTGDVCNGLLEPSSLDCGGITYEGCCDTAGRVVFCKSGQLFCVDCANEDPSCGWSDEGYYDCSTSGDPDPSDTYPMDCD
jgi:hypothetical protein